MITSITKEIINGVLSYVQTIRYSNGKTVRRQLDANGHPVAIIEDKP